jgi:hypothetical protein
MIRHSPGLSAAEIAKESIQIASEICVFTNDRLTLEILDCGDAPVPESGTPQTKKPITA